MTSQLESLLLVAGKPLAVKKLADYLKVDPPAAEEALAELERRYRAEERGVRLVRQGGEVELATPPENSELVREFLRAEELSELTRPQLEALTVVAYRGPVTKAELEQIRGVNCSLILRNLMIRGLIQRVEGEPARYELTLDTLRFLGLARVEELPDYERLHQPQNLEQFLAQQAAQESASG